jgi:hypothetical protein
MPGECPDQAKLDKPDITGPIPSSEHFIEWLKKAASSPDGSNSA